MGIYVLLQVGDPHLPRPQNLDDFLRRIEYLGELLWGQAFLHLFHDFSDAKHFEIGNSLKTAYYCFWSSEALGLFWEANEGLDEFLSGDTEALTLSLDDVVTAGEDAELLAINKAVLGLISVTLVPSIIIFMIVLNKAQIKL